MAAFEQVFFSKDLGDDRVISFFLDRYVVQFKIGRQFAPIRDKIFFKGTDNKIFTFIDLKYIFFMLFIWFVEAKRLLLIFEDTVINRSLVKPYFIGKKRVVGIFLDLMVGLL